MNEREFVEKKGFNPAEAFKLKQEEPARQQPNDQSNIKKVVAVISGKGGVGKSMVTALMAVEAQRSGLRCGILDADVTGPSIPRMFGLHDTAKGDGENMIYPEITRTGMPVMSVNLLLPNEDEPVIWRGPVISGAITQFWENVVWGDLDVLFIDMPPGTGDVALTIFQSLPVDGLVIVTSPQELVSMIVGKAVRMAQMMDIPVMGVVENMSYALCPDCGRKLFLFGESHLEETAARYGLPVLGRMPILPELAAAADAGQIETVVNEGVEQAFGGIQFV